METLIEEAMLKPFFQIVSYCSKEQHSQFDEPAFKGKMQSEFREEKYGHIYSIEKYTKPIEDVHVYVVSHSSPPSWIKKHHLTKEMYDKETDLLIIYCEGDYLFVHSSCRKLMKIVTRILGEDYRKLNYNEYAKFLSAQYDIQYRSLGILNIFGAGGMAPEAKSYHGKDTKQALTYTADSGFLMSYFLGSAIQNEDGDSEPLGCSPKKNKIWSGWTDGVSDFVNRCQEVLAAIDAGDGEFGLEVLVSPTDPVPDDPLSFYLDYTVHKKGYIILGPSEDNLSPNWECELIPDSSIIRFTIKCGEDDHKIDVKLDRHTDGIQWAFSEIDGKSIYMAFIGKDLMAEEEGVATISSERAKDLIEYLNKNENFTLLFPVGVAYRGGEYYKDKRFLHPFRGIYGRRISWEDVDIRKESSPPVTASKNISQAVQEHLQSLAPIVLINDDGANEAADFIAVTNKKYILVHAKYAKQDKPSLRIDNLQEVVSQAIKNLRFFLPEHVKNMKSRWRKNQITALPEDEIAQVVMEAVYSKMVEKECWIVQPGISQKLLDDDPDNKIHNLLNHLESLCRTQNIKLRLICSP